MIKRQKKTFQFNPFSYPIANPIPWIRVCCCCFFFCSFTFHLRFFPSFLFHFQAIIVLFETFACVHLRLFANICLLFLAFSFASLLSHVQWSISFLRMRMIYKMEFVFMYYSHLCRRLSFVHFETTYTLNRCIRSTFFLLRYKIYWMCNGIAEYIFCFCIRNRIVLEVIFIVY